MQSYRLQLFYKSHWDKSDVSYFYLNQTQIPPTLKAVQELILYQKLWDLLKIMTHKGWSSQLRSEVPTILNVNSLKGANDCV